MKGAVSAPRRPWQRASLYAIPHAHLLLQSFLPATSSSALIFAVDCRTPALSCLLMASAEQGAALLPTPVAVDMALAGLRLLAQEGGGECAALTAVALPPGAGISLPSASPAVLACRMDGLSGTVELECGGEVCLEASAVAVADSTTPAVAAPVCSQPARNVLGAVAAQTAAGSAVAAAEVPQEQAMFTATISLMASSVLQHTAAACGTDPSAAPPVLAAVGIVLPAAAAAASSRVQQLSLAAAVAALGTSGSAHTSSSLAASIAADSAVLLSASSLVHVRQHLQVGPPLPALQTVWVPSPVAEQVPASAQQDAPAPATWAFLSFGRPCSLESLVTLLPTDGAAIKVTNLVLLPDGAAAKADSTTGVKFVPSAEAAAHALKALRPTHAFALQLPPSPSLPGAN